MEKLFPQDWRRTFFFCAFLDGFDEKIQKFDEKLHINVERMQ